MAKSFNKMPEHQRAEFIYEKQFAMMTGLRARADLIDCYLIGINDQHTDELLEERKIIHDDLIKLHNSNMKLMDQLRPKRPLMAMDYSWIDDGGHVHRLQIKAGWREKTFNILTRLLRKWLLNGQMQLTD